MTRQKHERISISSAIAFPQTHQKIKRVCDLIVNYLEQEEIEYIFGITGKSITPIFDAISVSSIKAVSTRHEGGAAYMAYGYAQATQKLGVCCGTAGGGATNLISGVAAAYTNSVPLLVITGQIPTADYNKGGFQESTGEGRTINLVDMFKSTTKYSTQIINPNKASDIIRQAIRVATSGRKGPVHLNIPLDINLSPVKNIEIISRDAFMPTSSTQCDTKSLVWALSMIEQAKKPVFYMGWGTIASGGNHALIELAEKLNIPVTTSVQGKGGIPTNHPLCLGIMGLSGHPPAINYICTEADLLIAVGTSFNEMGTLTWDAGMIANKKIIQIDIDPTEIGKNFAIAVGLIGDAKLVLEQILDELKKKPMVAKFFKKLTTACWDLDKYVKPEAMTSTNIPIKPQRVLKEIRDNTPNDTIFIADSGAHCAWAIHQIPIYQGGMFFPVVSFGSMGTGICSSIGIKLARPSQPVICICGDGSFQMHGNEIGTAVQHNIPVIWVIFNDKRYNMPYCGTLAMYGRGEEVCKLKEVDFVKLALAFGIKGYKVTKPGELTRIIPEAMALGKPVVIDVDIDPEEPAPVGKRFKYDISAAVTA